MNEKTISFELKGRVAAVTGASYGLGVELATSLAEYGADVALLARTKSKLENVASDIMKKSGRKAVPVACDITSETAVKEAIAGVIKEFGKIDILVNNAGTIEVNPPEKHTLDQWNRVIGTDLTGVFLVCREVANQYMLEHGGKIVNVSSNTAFVTGGSACSYSVAKAGVVSLTRALGVAWAKYGIYVNGIAPGQMTNGTMSANTPEDVLERIREGVPLKRLGTYGDLSGALLYLASDACRFTVGETIVCDGGVSISM